LEWAGLERAGALEEQVRRHKGVTVQVLVGPIGVVVFGPDEGRRVSVQPDGGPCSGGFHIFSWRPSTDGAGIASVGGRRLDAVVDHAGSLAEVEGRFEELGWWIDWSKEAGEPAAAPDPSRD
jgi:hypothetical protein